MCTIYCRSRFYSFTATQPFLHYSDVIYNRTGRYVDIDLAEQTRILSNNGFLLEGRYEFIQYNTYFKHHQTTAASHAGPMFFNVREVSTFPGIFPNEYAEAFSPSFRAITIVLQATQEQEEVISSWIQGPTPPSDTNVLGALKGVLKVEKQTELACTFGLAQEIRSFLGEDFKSISNCQVFDQEHPYCEFATSRPDTLFYHKRKYFLDKTVIALSVSSDEAMAMSPGQESVTDSETTLDSSEVENIITGVGSEDKLGGEKGATQTVAAMILQATYVAKEAIINKKILGKAIIYGYLRIIKGGSNVWPYKLTMDFEERLCKICRGEETMRIEQFMHIVKDLLENPGKIE